MIFRVVAITAVLYAFSAYGNDCKNVTENSKNFDQCIQQEIIDDFASNDEYLYESEIEDVLGYNDDSPERVNAGDDITESYSGMIEARVAEKWEF